MFRFFFSIFKFKHEIILRLLLFIVMCCLRWFYLHLLSLCTQIENQSQRVWVSECVCVAKGIMPSSWAAHTRIENNHKNNNKKETLLSSDANECTYKKKAESERQRDESTESDKVNGSKEKVMIKYHFWLWFWTTIAALVLSQKKNRKKKKTKWYDKYTAYSYRQIVLHSPSRDLSTEEEEEEEMKIGD